MSINATLSVGERGISDRDCYLAGVKYLLLEELSHLYALAEESHRGHLGLGVREGISEIGGQAEHAILMLAVNDSSFPVSGVDDWELPTPIVVEIAKYNTLLTLYRLAGGKVVEKCVKSEDE